MRGRRRGRKRVQQLVMNTYNEKLDQDGTVYSA